MADALTQKDIDALLKKGEAASPKKRKSVDVIPYNFLRPPRVSRDRQSTLENIYNRFDRIFHLRDGRLVSVSESLTPPRHAEPLAVAR